jgi:mannosylglycerate hydrolase
MSEPSQLALVVSHTHWDREWYKTAEAFRIGLVRLIDELLDRDQKEPFLLDGQAIVLEDYLEWRPERRADMARALGDGSLEAGPWYALGDNLIPGGEALVRNLLAGRVVLRSLRASAPDVLYCPDSFGHPEAAPLLAAGFGFGVAIVWRGYGGRRWPEGDTARWRHPSGAEVVLHHLPPSGYEFGSSLPRDEAGAHERWRELSGVLGTRSRTGVLLVLNGADHHALQEHLDEARVSLGRAAAPVPVAVASLGAFADALRRRTAAMPLPHVDGELRASPDYVWSLQGTFGARAAQKRENAAIERFLIRHAEPWAGLLSWRRGFSHAFALQGIWRLVLANHPHDTLCGCSIDDVALAMTDRMRRAQRAAEELRRVVVGTLAGEGEGQAMQMVMLNPAPRTRGGLVEADVDIVLTPVPVGPGSGGVPLDTRQAPAFSVGSPALPVQHLAQHRTFVRDEAPRRYPRNALVERHRVLVWVPELPPFGLRTLSINEGIPPSRRAPRLVRVEEGRLVSDHLTVWVDEDEGLCVESASGTFRGLLGFESEGERGDLYTHSSIPDTQQPGELQRTRLVARGPLRAELVMSWRLPIAARTLAAATGEAVQHPAQAVAITVRVQLDAGRPWVRIVVDGTNDAEDVRLRMVCRTRIASPYHVADAAFGRVTRFSRPSEPAPNDVERLPGTAPLHRYVSLCDASGRGGTLLSDGLAEYEATEHGDIAVTLVRAVGELSRGDLPERAGHAGWPAATPLAQCRGPFSASFAFMPHGALTDDTIHAIEEAADDFLVPPVGWTSAGGATPGTAVRGLSLEGRGLRFEACKESTDGGSLIVRCTNLLSRVVEGRWSLEGMTEAALCRLDETPLGALAVERGSVAFQVAPFAVSTIRLAR